MPARLLLIAHATTVATRRAAFPDEDGLEERGRVAAASLAGQLPTADRLLASRSLAARQTATILAPQAGPPVVEDALRDLDVGSWAGRPLTEIGEAAAAWIADPQFAGHGGESVADCCARVSNWLLTSPSPMRGTTIGVTHASVIRAALVAVLDASFAAFWRVDAAPLTILKLSSDGRRWALRSLETPAPFESRSD